MTILQKLSWQEPPTKAESEFGSFYYWEDNPDFIFERIDETPLWKDLYSRGLRVSNDYQRVTDDAYRGFNQIVHGRLFRALRDCGRGVEIGFKNEIFTAYNIDKEMFYAMFPDENAIAHLFNTLVEAPDIA